MPSSPYRIRIAQRHEIDTMLQWAAGEGWNPGRHDAAAFHAADPDGFLIGLLDGQPVASISVVRYGPDYGFLGLYIVRPAYRGQGLGLQIWQAGLEHLGRRAIGLDGVVARQDDYRRSGFRLAHRNIRYQGIAAPPGAAPDQGIVPLSQLARGAVLDYDHAFFPADRSAFLHSWLRQPGAQALGLVRGGKLAGYGVMRPCLSGHKVGPLFADDLAGAAALLAALRQGIPAGSPFFLDVPETHAAAVELAQNLDMTPMFETARMYKGDPALPDMERSYGITTFELG